MEYILSLGALFYVIVFLLGLSVGSFLNAWVWRKRENVRIVQGRSMCLFCHRQLEWYENIPVVSFLALKGKCSVCKNIIPIHYLCVEVSMALTFLFLAWSTVHSANPNFVILIRNLIFTSLLVVIFIYDLLYQEILSGVVWFGAFMGLFFNFYLDYNLTALLVGAIAVSGFFFFQFIVSKGRWIGGGDVRLGVLMGVWLGWPVVVVALVMAYVSGALVGLFLVTCKKKTLASSTPFGTYLAMGTFICMIWGQDIVQWYAQFLR
jgi:prepilin signal peptidase PulO-like enzyme (type II secretory pathway)